MNRPSAGTALFALLALLHPGVVDAISPNEWQFRQSLEVRASGLSRVDLPLSTLDAARPNLEDLRIIDATGREIPYLVKRPLPAAQSVAPVKAFQAQIEGSSTRLNLVTGTNAPLRGLALHVAGHGEFIKAARIEGSHNLQNWETLADHQPLFRMADGATNLEVSLPESAWEFLRLTIDDSRSSAIPFTGADLILTASTAPSQPLDIAIKSRDETPGVTRISLGLSARNVTPSLLHIEAVDSVFARPITVAVTRMEGDDLVEQPLVGSIIYQMDVNGETESRLDLPIDRQIDGRELLVLIANGDSPPLTITGIRTERRAVYLIFPAEKPGRYRLLSGNRQCPQPTYDLSDLPHDLNAITTSDVDASEISANPEYKPADALAAVSLKGATIDVSPWRFRKPVGATTPGVQQVELDVDVLAGAARDLRDVRLVQDKQQIPFVIERTSISRVFPVSGKTSNDPDKPSLSRWSIKLPKAGIPITRIACRAGSGIFEREFQLFETVNNAPGETDRSQLGTANWTRAAERKPHDLVIEVERRPTGDSLFLETDNGDNPPVELRDFRAYCPVTRLIFKTPEDLTSPLWLYYGNADASAPKYDARLVARELLASDRNAGTSGPEESVNGTANAFGDTLSGSSRYIFWAILAAVVVGLLIVVARLVPKAD